MSLIVGSGLSVNNNEEGTRTVIVFTEAQAMRGRRREHFGKLNSWTWLALVAAKLESRVEHPG